MHNKNTASLPDVFPDTNIQSGVALVFHATVNHSHDAAANNAAEFLPLIFLAMHAQPIEDG